MSVGIKMETCYYYNNIILWRFRNCQFDCQPGQMMVTGSEKKEEKDEERKTGALAVLLVFMMVFGMMPAISVAAQEEKQ